MKYWNDSFLKLIKELEGVEITNRSTSFSVWAQQEVGFHDKYSDSENLDYSNKIGTLINKFEISLIKNEFSAIECEIVFYLIKSLKEKMNKEVTAHVILETMYMSLFRISLGQDILRVKEAMINLDSLFYSLKKYNSLKRGDIRILNSIISFLNITQFSYELLTEISKYKSRLSIVERDEKIMLEFKDISAKSVRKSLISYLSHLKLDRKIEISGKNGYDFFQENITKYSQQHNSSMKLGIVSKEFEILIPDYGFFSKYFFNKKQHLFIMNQKVAKSTINTNQLELIYAHEIFPGHFEHIDSGFSNKFNLLLPFITTKESLEGWALYQEYLLSKKSEGHKYSYNLQMARRYTTALFTLNTMGGLSKNENNCFFEHLMENFQVSEMVKLFLLRARKNSMITVRYISGFQQVVEMSNEEKDFVKKFGPIDLELVKKIVKF
ncbi:hypothetical protein [Lactococcus lactis]|uniref:Uncharacterized protein n=1 Tax=Lactococcus lactis TaxID=1358 RepID=A0A3S3N7H7_9LACT|nr:hypothetical protein [Lactococcus lactis]NYZ58194.1 hypothetical protein [Lactococcus lactis]RWR48469.1 hypothetical protein EO246_03015 [Lactococcus lactis]